MVAPGKERMAPAPADDQQTTQDTRWLNGVNRQLRPDATTHQHVASAAAAAKRKAGAMTEEERKAKDAERNQRNRAAMKAKRDVAAASAAVACQASDFDAALQQVAEDATLGDVERLDFSEWLQRQELMPN